MRLTVRSAAGRPGVSCGRSIPFSRRSRTRVHCLRNALNRNVCTHVHACCRMNVQCITPTLCRRRRRRRRFRRRHEITFFYWRPVHPSSVRLYRPFVTHGACVRVCVCLYSMYSIRVRAYVRVSVCVHVGAHNPT